MYDIIDQESYHTVRYNTVRYDTIWYNMVRYDTIWYGTIWYGTIRYGTVRYGTVWYGTVRYGTVQCGAVRYSTIRYDTIALLLPIPITLVNCEIKNFCGSKISSWVEKIVTKLFVLSALFNLSSHYIFSYFTWFFCCHSKFLSAFTKALCFWIDIEIIICSWRHTSHYTDNQQENRYTIWTRFVWPRIVWPKSIWPNQKDLSAITITVLPCSSSG